MASIKNLGRVGQSTNDKTEKSVLREASSNNTARQETDFFTVATSCKKASDNLLDIGRKSRQASGVLPYRFVDSVDLANRALAICGLKEVENKKMSLFQWALGGEEKRNQISALQKFFYECFKDEPDNLKKKARELIKSPPEHLNTLPRESRQKIADLLMSNAHQIKQEHQDQVISLMEEAKQSFKISFELKITSILDSIMGACSNNRDYQSITPVLDKALEDLLTCQDYTDSSDIEQGLQQAAKEIEQLRKIIQLREKIEKDLAAKIKDKDITSQFVQSQTDLVSKELASGVAYEEWAFFQEVQQRISSELEKNLRVVGDEYRHYEQLTSTMNAENIEGLKRIKALILARNVLVSSDANNTPQGVVWAKGIYEIYIDQVNEILKKKELRQESSREYKKIHLYYHLDIVTLQKEIFRLGDNIKELSQDELQDKTTLDFLKKCHAQLKSFFEIKESLEIVKLSPVHNEIQWTQAKENLEKLNTVRQRNFTILQEHSEFLLDIDNRRAGLWLGLSSFKLSKLKSDIFDYMTEEKGKENIDAALGERKQQKDLDLIVELEADYKRFKETLVEDAVENFLKPYGDLKLSFGRFIGEHWFKHLGMSMEKKNSDSVLQEITKFYRQTLAGATTDKDRLLLKEAIDEYKEVFSNG